MTNDHPTEANDPNPIRKVVVPDLVFHPDLRVIQAQLPNLERRRPLTGRWTG